jgi:hypothetical protein
MAQKTMRTQSDRKTTKTVFSKGPAWTKAKRAAVAGRWCKYWHGVNVENIDGFDWAIFDNEGFACFFDGTGFDIIDADQIVKIGPKVVRPASLK